MSNEELAQHIQQGIDPAGHDTIVEILRLRFIDRLTLEEAGERLGITRERVRQYEALALRRLRSNSRSKRLINYLVA